MKRALPREMAAFLDAHGPATVKQIALGVRARRADVAAVLAGDGFVRTGRPEGAHPSAVYYVASRRVPARRSRRAWRLFGLLADGLPHSRSDCRAVAGDYPNNAAAELRRLGFDVRYDRGSDSYQLFSRAGSEARADGVSCSVVSGPAGERSAA